MTKAAPKENRNEATPLMHFSEYNTFQGFYMLSPADESISSGQIFNKCILYITNWLKARIDKNLHCDKNEVRFLYDYPVLSDFEEGEPFDVFENDPVYLKRAKKQFDIAVFGLKDLGEWTIRIREPNNKAEKGFLDWLFTTDIALKQDENYVYLAVRTKCKESHDHSEKATPFRPTFLPEMFSDKCFVVTEGGFDSNYPIEMDTLGIYKSSNQKNDDFEFIKVLNNPNRQMPVILCPSCFTADSEHDQFRIEKLSNHMAGEAYVVVDEAHNGYRYLFERMETFFKSIGENRRNASEMIKTNYLCINPIPDEYTQFNWFPVDSEADQESSLRAEIKRAENYVNEYYLRKSAAKTDFNFGNVLFYSDLWKEYVNKSDSSVVENLKSKLATANTEIEELKTVNADNEELAQLQSTIRDLNKDIVKLTNESARNEEKLKNTLIKVGDLSGQISELEKNNKELTESLRKNFDYKLENEKLEFFLRFMSVPFNKKDLLKWVEENMGDLIQINIASRAKNKCADYINSYPDDGKRLRDAFIRLYAEFLFKSGNEKMPEELYNLIIADSNVSSFQVEPCGGDEDLCEEQYGDRPDGHVTYSSGDKNGKSIRIYYKENKELEKCIVIAVGPHVTWK